jgi:hypothetical protein
MAKGFGQLGGYASWATILGLVYFSRAMTSKAEQWIELAEAAEFRLSDPELKLLRCVAAGEVADFRNGDESRNDPEQAGWWGEERWLPADLIAWVCTDRDAREFITQWCRKLR